MVLAVGFGLPFGIAGMNTSVLPWGNMLLIYVSQSGKRKRTSEVSIGCDCELVYDCLGWFDCRIDCVFKMKSMAL